MSAESEVIEHTYTVADATVTRFGFGIALIAGYHNYWPERVRTFSNADDMTLTPFNMPTTHAIYKAAQKLKSQFKVGKLLGAIAQSVELTPSTPEAGDVYSLSVDGTPVSVTADGTPTVAEICAALTTAISAVADVTAVDGSTKVTVNGDTAGLMHAFEALSSNLTLKDVTALPTITPATDLAAIKNADGDWYGLALVNGGEAAIEDAAAWVETQKALLIAQTSDSGVLSGSVTTDVASDKSVRQQPAAGWLGVMLPKLPGPAAWANKSIAGVDMSTIDDTARGVLNTKRANYYVAIKGLGFTLHGNAGSGRRLGITVILDWFDVGVSDRVILIELARAQVLGQILEGVELGLIDGEQAYAATAPDVTEVDPVDKANAVLGDIQYTYVAVLGIEKVRIKGVVRV
jgi:hypothetical protein